MRKAALAMLMGMIFVADVPAKASVPQAADIVLFDGKIFTGNDARPYVEALAIRGDRIIATGTSSQIEALAGPTTERIDLQGRTVIPGINDAHAHLHVNPTDRYVLKTQLGDPTWSDIRQAVAQAQASTAQGTFLEGDLGLTLFRDPTMNRATLDVLSPDRPIMLETISGHASLLNSAALARMGISDASLDPLGGRLERQEDGKLDGVLREYAEMQPDRRLTEQTGDADAVLQLQAYFARAAKFGITSLQDMANAIPPARCVDLLERASVPIRVRVMRMPLTTPAARDRFEGQGMPWHPSGLITVSGVKWILDGTPLEGTFAPRILSSGASEPSLDDEITRLQLTFPMNEIRAIFREALALDEPLLLHVSGYPAARAVTQVMAASGGSKVWWKKRVRIEHGDGIYPDLIPPLKNLGIVVVQNPSHLASISLVPAKFPNGPALKGQPLRSLIEAGIPVAFGSDGVLNPYLNILFATLHPDRPSEAITREQAVNAYTRVAAYAEFAEKDLGTLEPNKLADLAVLSQDIFTVASDKLPQTESVMTMVGGKVIYDSHAL